MSKKHNFVDDLSKLFQSALSNAANLGQEAKKSMHHKFEELVSKMDIAHKEELDVVRKMAQKNHKEIQAIKEHLGLKSKPASANEGKVAKVAKPTKSSK